MSEPSGEIHSWQNIRTGEWVEGKPPTYSDVKYVKFVVRQGNRPPKYFQLRNPPRRPGLTADQNTDWIETILLPRLWTPYLVSNG